MKTGLTESMRDFQVVEFEAKRNNRDKKSGCWKIPKQVRLLPGLNHVLLVSHFDRDMLPHLTGLLHDMAHSMARFNHRGYTTVMNRDSDEILICQKLRVKTRQGGLLNRTETRSNADNRILPEMCAVTT
jgi:hypothetical protein